MLNMLKNDTISFQTISQECFFLCNSPITRPKATQGGGYFWGKWDNQPLTLKQGIETSRASSQCD